MTAAKEKQLNDLTVKEQAGTITADELTKLEALRMEKEKELQDEINANAKPLTSSADIVTDLPEQILKVKIFKVKKMKSEADSSEFYMISALDMLNNRTLTLSASAKMIAAFDYDGLIKEGHWIGDGEKAIYQSMSAVFVPNDGIRYGYIDKATKTAIPYRNTNMWMIRSFSGTISHEFIQQYEVRELQGDAITVKVKALFRALKGKEYISGVNSNDDAFFAEMFIKMA